jgi:hypothetical protein
MVCNRELQLSEMTVKIVFLDEAGTSNVEQEPHLVVAGVIVDYASQWQSVNQKVTGVCARHQVAVLHAADIFNGHEKKTGYGRHNGEWTKIKADEMAADVVEIILELSLPLVWRSVDRVAFNADPLLHDPDSAVVQQQKVAFAAGLMLVEGWMRRNASDDGCIVVHDDNSSANAALSRMQKDFQTVCLPDSAPKECRDLWPAQHIFDVPLFGRDEVFPALQLADFCAYVAKRQIMKTNPGDRYLKIAQRLNHLVVRH